MQYQVSIITSLYRCEQYLRSFFEAIKGVESIHNIEFILLFNDPLPEEMLIVNQYVNKIPHVNFIVVEKRENLYATWNRGILAAAGEFLTIWNVDDFRTTAGIEVQLEYLTSHKSIGLVYGDYFTFSNSTTVKDILFEGSSSNKYHLASKFYGGPFMMWRKAIHSEVGYFDEQFKSAGDYDFWVRVIKNYSIKKVTGIMGDFYISSGISKTGNVNNVERTLIEIRYGVFHKLDFLFVMLALRKYSLFELSSNGRIYSINTFHKSYCFQLFRNSPLLLISIIRFPFYSVLPKIIKYFRMMNKRGISDTTRLVISKFSKVG